MRQSNKRHPAATARFLGAALLAALLAFCSPAAQTITPGDLADYIEQGKAGKAFKDAV